MKEMYLKTLIEEKETANIVLEWGYFKNAILELAKASCTTMSKNGRKKTESWNDNYKTKLRLYRDQTKRVKVLLVRGIRERPS